MTNKLAIKIFKRLIKHGFTYDDGYGQEELTNDEEEACKLAIKALDVVDGLEDAIAEIEKLITFNIDGDYISEAGQGMQDCLEIINRYREGEES